MYLGVNDDCIAGVFIQDCRGALRLAIALVQRFPENLMPESQKPPKGGFWLSFSWQERQRAVSRRR
jgi:hypothetical protein